ncbi:glycoside hydrolase [Irpex rosettiformis]|uniref:Glycoside hydrolase n=1 Tax=Irpex rosettiformis TaxID=378272 RepID=A0ACB8U2G0_9APHY|nr:glycoside hydrolase [Irpex rosettiformis]
MCTLRSSGSAAATSASPTAPAAGAVSSPAPSSSGNSSVNDIVATTWYAGYSSDFLAPADIPWGKYTQVTYAFGEPQNDGSISFEASNEPLISEFVQQAHSHNVKALATIGGWTGSSYFSSAFGSADNRTAFVKQCQSVIQKYQLDGLDFDWEYPSDVGAGCNVNTPQDTANFLSFLQELRQAEPNVTLSAATSISPFKGSTGSPSSDVSGFAKVLDYIAIMNYDVYGSWSTAVGPNAPLDDSCAPSGQQQGSATSAVKAWTAAGFPANQLVLGVAGYGHSFDVSSSAAFASQNANSSSFLPTGTKALAAYPAFDKSHQPAGDNRDEDAPAGVDQCGNASPGGFSGIFNFNGLIERGILDQNGTAASGMGFRFDSCSQTPYVYVPDNSTMISYDDPTSFAAKGKFIAEQGLRGFALWEASTDSNNLLVDSISNAIGIQEVSC